MKRILPIVALLASTACGSMMGGRQVEVTTGAEPAAESGIHMTNNLTQAVNVYVVSGGTDMFLKQVSANSTEHIPVRGVSSGTSVTLKATTVDGQRTYTRANVTMSSMFEWRVP